MSAQVIDITSSPNGNRYSEAEKEAAYLCWRIPAGRSLRKAAELMNISASTLGTWSQTHGWVKRADEEAADAAESMRLSIESRVIGVAHEVVEVFEGILKDKTASARDRMEAGKWLAGIAGVAPVIKSETAFIDRSKPKAAGQATQVDELIGKSPAELMLLEQAAKSKRDAA